MTQPIHILFFAGLADALQCQSEQLHLANDITTVQTLKNLLAQRKGNWLALNENNIRCAVNQDIVKPEHPIKAGDEVAFFPPVTGG